MERVGTTRAIMLGRAFPENDDPGPPAELIKKTLKIYPYQPGGHGTNIGTALAASPRGSPKFPALRDWSCPVRSRS